ncbi:DUF1592 domain-containing protein [Isosphaeraceae bacterium EP7]
MATLLAFGIWGCNLATAAESFVEQILPILEDHCFACHGNGIKKGGVDLESATPRDSKLWWAVLKNVRSGLMPPGDSPQPSAQERRQLESWIKLDAFGIDPEHPDPGRLTVHRLNRVEYRNTIRDLMGVDFDTTAEFPSDDSGHGFDNNGDVLTLSPLLIEKYLAAAKSIVASAVPSTSKVVARREILSRDFRREGVAEPASKDLSLSYYEAATVKADMAVEHGGQYRLLLEMSVSEKYVDGMNDENRCRLLVRIDAEELHREEFGRRDGRTMRLEFDRELAAGPHELSIEIQPLTPEKKQVRALAIRFRSIALEGPQGERFGVKPPNYARFFPGTVPEDGAGRHSSAREILGRFAEKAYRRPVDERTKDRLADMAEATWELDGQTFEAGVSQAMTAVLTSPRFLFREEDVDPDSPGRYPLVGEYELASRLSYFLWSTMPDDELFRLAAEHRLRENLGQQVARMLADSRSGEFSRHFVGQWLQARDIETVLINGSAIAARDEPPDPSAERLRARFRLLNRKAPGELSEEEKKELRESREAFQKSFRRFREFELTSDLRKDMRHETEMLFEHVVREDRPLLDLLDGDYTFLNERLARHYGIEGIKGVELRRVELPEGSPRGGVLTQGTILAVTSNPDRTSPVKRGLFILENILGSPPAPPPPNIPSLEESGKAIAGRTPTLRESMVLHRSMPLCSSCHSRMDPLGLSLENFNALGRWRDNERTVPIDATGKLITGEPFRDIRDLKRILVEKHSLDFYRCLSEKMLTYALGRGLEPYDVQAVDTIVGRIEAGEGRASALVSGIIDSVPFQKRRRETAIDTADVPVRQPRRAPDSTR